jgi:hypothetical protein
VVSCAPAEFVRGGIIGIVTGGVNGRALCGAGRDIVRTVRGEDPRGDLAIGAHGNATASAGRWASADDCRWTNQERCRAPMRCGGAVTGGVMFRARALIVFYFSPAILLLVPVPDVSIACRFYRGQRGWAVTRTGGCMLHSSE